MKKTLGLASLITGLLCGCSYNPLIDNNHTTGSAESTLLGAGIGVGTMALLGFGGSKPALVAGGLGGGALGYYFSTLRYDAGGIIQGGGKVYTLGKTVGIYLPSDQLFESNTAEFRPQAKPILDSVVQVLKRYPNNNIIISGNTSGFARPYWEQRLSERRAQRVSAYLWNAGINQFQYRSNYMRKLNYVGYGNYFPISNDYTNPSIRENSRIQITSYPSDCDLHLDEQHIAVRNMGAFDDDNSAPTCQGCFKDDIS
jgi:outer membrane protein OmpA-like peptidoglycan-associated protein